MLETTNPSTTALPCPAYKGGLHSPDFEVRGGLSNFIKSAEAGQDTRVAYMGASSTLLPGWRDRSFAWLQKRFLGTELIQINACRGAEGIGLAHRRLDESILTHEPHLVFLELSVVSDKLDHYWTSAYLEDMIRRCKSRCPQCEVVLVHATSRALFNEAQSGGELPSIIREFERVAEYYGITSLNFFLNVWKRFERQEIVYGMVPGT
jgi:hypothetical protein